MRIAVALSLAVSAAPVVLTAQAPRAERANALVAQFHLVAAVVASSETNAQQDRDLLEQWMLEVSDSVAGAALAPTAADPATESGAVDPDAPARQALCACIGQAVDSWCEVIVDQVKIVDSNPLIGLKRRDAAEWVAALGGPPALIETLRLQSLKVRSDPPFAFHAATLFDEFRVSLGEIDPADAGIAAAVERLVPDQFAVFLLDRLRALMLPAQLDEHRTEIETIVKRLVDGCQSRTFLDEISTVVTVMRSVREDERDAAQSGSQPTTPLLIEDVWQVGDALRRVALFQDGGRAHFFGLPERVYLVHVRHGGERDPGQAAAISIVLGPRPSDADGAQSRSFLAPSPLEIRLAAQIPETGVLIVDRSVDPPRQHWIGSRPKDVRDIARAVNSDTLDFSSGTGSGRAEKLLQRLLECTNARDLENIVVRDRMIAAVDRDRLDTDQAGMFRTWLRYSQNVSIRLPPQGCAAAIEALLGVADGPFAAYPRGARVCSSEDDREDRPRLPDEPWLVFDLIPESR